MGLSWRRDEAVPVFCHDCALNENSAMKHAKATTAKLGSARGFELLFIGRLSTGGAEKGLP